MYKEAISIIEGMSANGKQLQSFELVLLLGSTNPQLGKTCINASSICEDEDSVMEYYEMSVKSYEKALFLDPENKDVAGQLSMLR
jgi:hypothetical protein